MNDFAELVYTATRKIPEGKVCTYGAVAKEIGNPKAARAVGAVLKKNPYGIESGCNSDQMVPCHRVVNMKGELTGFFGKTDEAAFERKRNLLEKEGVDFNTDGKVSQCCIHRKF
jgi:methylated-DNA-[protein]-cysteine S-methyltransferase